MSKARHSLERYVKKVFGLRSQPTSPWPHWFKNRREALRGLHPIYQGMRVECDVANHAWCVPFELCGPQRGEVLIRTIASAVSPGTELAFFCRQPNANTTFPYYPGYSLVGAVVEVGRDVEQLSVGQIVATSQPHASLVKIPAREAFIVPDGVRPEEAAFFQLGIIGYQGVWLSQLTTDERVAVFGRGSIGHVVIQIARSFGASEIISIAPSPTHITPALQRYTDHIVVTNELSESDLHTFGADVTYEVTGHPEAIHEAIAVTRDGGRVILLGSPRGVTKGLDFGVLASRRITLRGAHVSTLSRSETTPGLTYSGAAEAFFRLVVERKLDVRGVTDLEVNPWEAGWFYQSLSEGRLSCAGALFRWDQMDPADRMKPVRYWALPDREATRHAQMKVLPSLNSIPSFQQTPVYLRDEEAYTTSTDKDRCVLRIAIIGCGERGSINARAAQKAKSVSLEVVMDINETLAKALGERTGVPWTVDYEAVLADDKVDVVFINTPHSLHLEQALLAARAGKHLIVEKPLATSVDDAMRMIHAARENQVRLSTWLGMRYLPQVVRAKQLVDARALGTVLGGHLTFNKHKPASYWQGGYSGAGTDWRAQWQTSGGGVLIMTGIHYLDWLLYLSKLKIVEVSARYATLSSPSEVEDTLVMWLTLENGALLTGNFSSCVQGLREGLVEFRLWGAEGTLFLTPPYQLYSSRFIEDKRPERWNSLEPLPRLRHAHIEYLDRYASALLKNEPFEIADMDGLVLQAVIEAAYRSSRERRPVQVAYPEL